MTEPLTVHASFWPDPGGTPLEILDRPPGLRTVYGKGRSKHGDTTTVRIEYAVPERHDKIYGGRARSALNVVAINLLTGAVYANAPTSPHSVALADAMKPKAGGPPGEGMSRVTTAVLVNVDIPWLTAIPPDAGEFVNVVWVDEIASQPTRFSLPRSDARPGVPKTPAKPPVGAAIAFQPRTAAAGAKLLDVEPDGADPSKRLMRGMISGTLLSPDASKDGRKPIFTIVVLDMLTRQIGYESVFLPDKADQQVFSFTANLETILKTLPGAGEGRIFVIAHVDGTVSAPLAFEPPKRP